MIVNVKSIHRRLRILGLEKIAKIENISINKLNEAEKLQEKSIDELKAIARLRRIKNFEKLTKRRSNSCSFKIRNQCFRKQL